MEVSNPPVPRLGRCKVCGRQVPGILKEHSLTECVDPCPRCGADPFYLDGIGPYAGNVARMDPAEARRFALEIDDTREIEVCFRLEIIGHPPDGRRSVMEALYAQYWVVAMMEDPGARGRIMELDEAIEVWKKLLEDPTERRYYGNLVRVSNAENVAPGSMDPNSMTPEQREWVF